MSCMSWVRWVLLAAAGMIALPAQACDDARWAECVGWPEAGVVYDEVDPATRSDSVDEGVSQTEQLRLWRARAKGDDEAALSALIELAWHESQRRRRTVADGYYGRALELAPQDGVLRRRAHWSRAQSCAWFGDFSCAREHWYRAATSIAGHPRWLPAAYAYGLWQLGVQEQAVAWYTAAVHGDARLGRGAYAGEVAPGTPLNRISRELFAAWSARHATLLTTVVAELEIAPDGRVQRVSLHPNELAPPLAMRVQAAIAGWRFEPPQHEGRPVVLGTYAQVDVRGRVDDEGEAQFEVQFVSSGVTRKPGDASHLRYPSTALRRGKQGVAQVRALVDASGKVERTELLRSSGHRELDQAATSAIEKWNFLTETVDGVGLPDEVVLPIQFRLTTDVGDLLWWPPSYGVGRAAAIRALTRRL